MAEKLYRRVPAVEDTTVGDRAVLYHSGSGTAVVLNATASLLWKRLDTPADVATLSGVLHERFPHIELETIESDTLAALGALEMQNLVTSA